MRANSEQVTLRLFRPALAGHVEAVLHPAYQKQALIPVRRRFVPEQKGQLHKNGLYRLLCLPDDPRILRIVQPPLSEAEAGKEPKIEVLPNLQVRDHVQIKARPVQALYPNDGVRENKLLTPKRRIAARIEAQRKPEVKRLVLEIVEIVVVPARKLGMTGRRSQAKENKKEQR